MQPLPKRGSGLDYHYTVVQRTLLAHQDPVTGLLPAHQIEGCENHAWIRFAGFLGCLFVHEIGCKNSDQAHQAWLFVCSRDRI